MLEIARREREQGDTKQLKFRVELEMERLILFTRIEKARID